MIMKQTLTAALMTLALADLALAQDGPLQRAGQALDRTGKNIRARVETEIAKGEVAAEERDVLRRVLRRIEWDKRFAGSTLRLESRAGGTMVLRGSVLSVAVKRQAVELVENTTGVTAVVDELAVVESVKVIRPTPAARVIEVTPPAASETKVIVKP
jgi:hyperosmotically inducible periplasmic protein